MTGEIDGIARGIEHVAENRLIDISSADSRALDRDLRSVNGKIYGRESLQFSAERAEGRSQRREKDYASLLSCNTHICQYTFWVPDRFLGRRKATEQDVSLSLRDGSRQAYDAGTFTLAWHQTA